MRTCDLVVPFIFLCASGFEFIKLVCVTVVRWESGMICTACVLQVMVLVAQNGRYRRRCTEWW